MKKMITTAIVAVAVTGFAVPPAPAQTHGQKPSEGLGHMEHRFDDPERYAKEFDDPGRDAWQMPTRVIEALALKPGQKVADIGAGTGYFSMRLAASPATPTVFAVDIEPSMVAHLTKRATAEKRTNVVAVQAAADSPNLPEAMDVVLIVDTYHHIPNRPCTSRVSGRSSGLVGEWPSWTSARVRPAAGRPTTFVSPSTRLPGSSPPRDSCSTHSTTSCPGSCSSCTASSRSKALASARLAGERLWPWECGRSPREPPRGFLVLRWLHTY